MTVAKLRTFLTDHGLPFEKKDLKAVLLKRVVSWVEAQEWWTPPGPEDMSSSQ